MAVTRICSLERPTECFDPTERKANERSAGWRENVEGMKEEASDGGVYTEPQANIDIQTVNRLYIYGLSFNKGYESVGRKVGPCFDPMGWWASCR